MLFLTVQPLIVNCQLQIKEPAHTPRCCGDKSCDKKRAEQRTGKKDCEGTSAGNPFAFCSQCQYTAVRLITYAGIIDKNSTTKTAIINENIESGFKADCWHPPKFCLS